MNSEIGMSILSMEYNCFKRNAEKQNHYRHEKRDVKPEYKYRRMQRNRKL